MSIVIRLVTPPAILLAMAFTFMGYHSAGVNAQTYQGDELPANVLAATLNGEPVDANSTPVVTNPQPTISGQLAESNGTVTIHITSDPQTFTATVGSDGRFSAQVPQPLDDGVHTLYFDGARIGTFTVVAAAASPTPSATATIVPGPPATGAGTSSTGQWSVAGAGVVGLAVAASVVAMWALRRRVPGA